MTKVKAYPWYVKIIFWLQRRKYGQVLNSALMWAKSPKVFLSLSLLYGSIDRKGSPIPPGLRSLIIVRVSQINGCAFCVDLNTSVLLERHGDLEKVNALSRWHSSTLFSDREKAALAYAEAVSDSKKALDESFKTKVREYFNEKELVELTAIIAFQNMSTKFNNAFGIEPQGFCSINH